jgi:large subunit ribosomal protein L3
MEYIVKKIGMSRTIQVPSRPVTLLKVVDTKVCEINQTSALVAYSKGKKFNRAIEGQQKKYSLSKEFNRFLTLDIKNAEGVSVGDLSTEPLESAASLKSTFKSKGRGFTGVVKRYNFSGGPSSHGSRFHRRVGSIGNAEWPGRVQPGKKMPGRYGMDSVTVKNEIVSFDKESGILAVKGAVPGANGAFGKIRIVK